MHPNRKDIITHEQARKSLQRFINLHFHNAGEKSRASIPAHQDDDDILLSDYISQQAAGQPSGVGEPRVLDACFGDPWVWSEGADHSDALASNDWILIKAPALRALAAREVGEPRTGGLCENDRKLDGPVSSVDFITNAEDGRVARTRSVSDSTGNPLLLLPDYEWANLSSDSQRKIQKWFEIATEHLEQMLAAREVGEGLRDGQELLDKVKAIVMLRRDGDKADYHAIIHDLDALAAPAPQIEPQIPMRVRAIMHGILGKIQEWRNIGSDPEVLLESRNLHAELADEMEKVFDLAEPLAAPAPKPAPPAERAK